MCCIKSLNITIIIIHNRMAYLTVIVNECDIQNLVLGGEYFAMVIGGILSGFGIGLYLMLINTLFWSK